MGSDSEMNGRLVPDDEGDSIPLLKNRLSLGSDESCDITFRFPSVPARLCELSWDDGFWHVRDTADPPALLVNDRPTSGERLQPGDLIHIGQRRYTIDYTPQPA